MAVDRQLIDQPLYHNFVMPLLTPLINDLKAVDFRRNMEQLILLLRNGEIDTTELLQLTVHRDTKVSFHAAWLLEIALTRYPEEFIEHLPDILRYGALATNPSCHRHYMKIFSCLTRPKAPASVKEQLADTDMEPLISLCFEKLADPLTRVAVKVCAGETLCHLTGRYPFITSPLITQLQALMQNGSQAILSAGCRLLKVLQK